MQAGVVGAGIMGCLLALRLHQAGWQVSIYDENPIAAQACNCSQAAAGLLAPVSELDKADALIFHLGMESLNSLWPTILRSLTTPLYYQHKGCLLVHHPQDKTAWQQFSVRIRQQLGERYYQTLTSESLWQLEPELTQFNSAYYVADEAHLDSRQFMDALRSYLGEQGLIWHAATKVLAVEPGVVTTEQTTQTFHTVFDCRGLGAKSIFPQLRGIRGELIYLHAPEVNLQRPLRLLHPRYHIYIVPRPKQHYLIGASELETELVSPISVRTTLELLTAAYYLHAGFAEARLVETITQIRPTLPHHQPRIRYAPGLIAVNGLYRHGYLIAPALAEEVLRGLTTNRQEICYPELWEAYHA